MAANSEFHRFCMTIDTLSRDSTVSCHNPEALITKYDQGFEGERE